MSISLSRSIVSVLVGSVLASGAFAQSSPRINVRPQVRVVEKVDSKKSTVIANSTPSIVANAVDNGRLASSTQFNHLMLVLKSSDEQELALHGLLDDQQDKSSPNYHQWMTPDTFGAAFGAASSDVAKVTAWLQDSGFSVNTTARGGRVISFSGTSGQIESAFKTEMHRITVNGETHISNTKDISVPSALSPVIAGLSSLNDFRPRSNRAVNPRTVAMGTDGQLHPVLPGTTSPDYTSLSSGSHYVGPADLAVIYNAKPLQASGIDGTGVTIGVLGQTSVTLADVQTYRQLFNLPVNDPQIINVDNTPATIGDDIESDLDLELAGSLATKAKIKFYTAPYSYTDGGVDTSALAVVDTNGADIISLSYGECEVNNTSSGTAYWNNLWEQAAAQGQTVFVSTGDSSATGCAPSNSTVAANVNNNNGNTYAVNALGSSAYNVAVGGSEFNEGTTGGVTAFWGPGGFSPYGTALSYIPETVWSEGVFDMVQAASGISGSGGGVSLFTGRPSWQVGSGIAATDPAGPTFTAPGAIPAGTPHRLVPDVSLIAASGHDATIFCSEGSCKLNSDGTVASLGLVGGTSVATPTMAGVQALINQKNGGRQGNANYYYYKLAAAQTTANCASTNSTTALAAAGCNFYDIVSGDNYSPLTSTGKYNASTNTISGKLGTDYIGFPATTGFDEATGLGTPNITNLANNWSTVTFNATKTALTLTPTTTVHGTTMTAVISVTANAGTPTGDVSLTAIGQSAGAGDANVYTLSGGTVTASISSLPGGTYSVTAHYAGDSVYGTSDSAPVTVTISKEPSTTTISTYYFVQIGQSLYDGTAATYAYGTSIDITTQVQGVSATGYTNNGAPNTGSPTGTMTYTLASGGTTLAPYVATVNPGGNTSLEIAQNFTGFDIFAYYPALAPATYTVQTAYSGDNSFGTSTANSSITVVKASVNPTLRTSSAEIASAATATFNVTIAASGGGVLPTGTVTLTDNTTATVLGSGTLTNGAVVITSNLILTPGAHSVVAAYGGDGNYNATTSTATTVTVGGTATTVTVQTTTGVNTVKVLTAVPFIAYVPSGVTGTVYFYDGALSLGSANISTATYTASLTVSTLTAGTHFITANYAGSGTYQAATSAPFTMIVNQNTPTLQLTSQEANTSFVPVAQTAVLTLVPANAAVANPAPSAPIQFLDGTTVLATVPLSYTLNYHTYAAANTIASLKPGPHSLSAKFAGDLNYAAATSNVQVVGIGLTTTTLTTSTTNVGTGIPFTLTATVVPQVPNATALTGTVSFYNGATLLGTATISGGTATLTTATLTGVGTFNLTAVYSGDNNYYTSTSTSTVTITTVTPSFYITVTPPSITIPRGGSGTLSVNATSVGNYNGFGNLSCQGLPANTFCSFSQPALLLTGANGTTKNTTITVYTTYAASNKQGAFSSIRSAGLLWIPAVFLAGFLGLRRKQLTLRGRQLMTFAILLCGVMAVSGCNGNLGTTTPAGSTLGTSTITVIATGTGVTSASPSIAPTATFQLTIQ